ncbi:MAG TPA: hypothetical protein VGW38_08785 [Chloroflexota bacterium]|nr:hypothetical protein [Chloroflexota bacterium]
MPWYRVTFTHPDGFTYAANGQAESAAEAVQLADRMLEYVERIGISDYLSADGVSVRPPALLRTETIPASEAGSGFGLVVTDAGGNVVRRK